MPISQNSRPLRKRPENRKPESESAALKKLFAAHSGIKPRIKERLASFARLGRAGGKDIFSELCFCLLTANANALLCDRAIKELKDKGLIWNGGSRRIAAVLKGKARFHNKKAIFIVLARRLFRGRGGRIDIKKYLKNGDIFATREWLVRNIKGFGYKEASHFLRNIGLGEDIAILDRHILKNLLLLGVIGKIPASLGSKNTYLGIEDKMRRFSRRAGIPLAELDLLFWSLQTGFVFR
jgi:N-glycosylase/DNA lyase